MDIIKKHSLYLDIHRAIEHSIDSVRNMHEPDYIAALVTKLPRQLSSILQQYYPHNKFRVGGCFIHQKPLARFFTSSSSNKKAPEIGDLLIVYKEISHTGNIYHNALILQAKKADNIYYSPVSHNDSHQLRLYREWPKFKYERAGILNGTVRSISPKTFTPGAQYLLISEGNLHPCTIYGCTFWCAIPNDILVASKSLALELIDFIEFQTGRPFVPRKGNIDQWSKMIWDLLGITSNTVFNRRKAGFKLFNRSAGDFISFLLDHGEYVEVNHNLDDNNSGGISVLVIERDNSERNN